MLIAVQWLLRRSMQYKRQCSRVYFTLYFTRVDQRNGGFTPEQHNDKTNVEPVHSYDAFHTRFVGPGVKGIIGMHRFNICLVVVLLWCENTISQVGSLLMRCSIRDSTIIPYLKSQGLMSSSLYLTC